VYLVHLHELALLGEGAARSLDDHARGEVAGAHALREVLALHQLGQEAAHEGIAGAVGVHQQVGGEGLHWVGGHLAGTGHHGGGGSLGEHHHAGAGAGGLGLGGELQGDGGQVGAVALDLAVGGGLGLVGEHEVGIVQGRGQLVAEELDDEGGGQVEAVDLVLLHDGLADVLHGLHGHGQEETCA
jgi:hypothetical protein